MAKRAAIVGIGQTKCSERGNGYDHKELLYLATKQALADAGVERKDITSAFTTSLDFLEGRSLSNQYTLDSIGGVMKPCDLRIGEDGVYGIFAAYLEAASHPAQVVVVGSVQKASDRAPSAESAVFLTHVETAYIRPILADLPYAQHCYAAMEARRYMHRYGISLEQIAKVAVKNTRNARGNPLAQRGREMNVDDVLNSPTLAGPIRSLMVAEPGDGACALVVASEDVATRLSPKPVWVAGVGWCSDTWYPGKVELARADFIEKAATAAYSMAGISDPAREIDVAEVYDDYAFHELQYCEALGLCGEGEGGRFIDSGASQIGGALPVNPSGGLLGHGNPIGTAGLMRVAQAALQLRGDAGECQVPDARAAVVQGCQWPWRSGGVAVLSRS